MMMEFDEELPKNFKTQLKYLNFGFTFNFVFLLNGLVGIAETTLQIIFSILSKNFIYFVACALFGPFQILAVVLLLFISKHNISVLYFRIFFK